MGRELNNSCKEAEKKDREWKSVSFLILSLAVCASLSIDDLSVCIPLHLRSLSCLLYFASKFYKISSSSNKNYERNNFCSIWIFATSGKCKRLIENGRAGPENHVWINEIRQSQISHSKFAISPSKVKVNLPNMGDFDFEYEKFASF